MSQKREIEQHIASLRDISEIMRAMKNLSLIENRKLNRYLATQARVVKSIESAANDILIHNDNLLPEVKYQKTLIVLIGSERGFCGDFNRRLSNRLQQFIEQESLSDYLLLTVGSKVSSHYQDDERVIASLLAPHVAEEIDAVLVELVETVNLLQERYGPLRVLVIYNGVQGAESEIKQILPPFQHAPQDSIQKRCHPDTNLPAPTLLMGLIEQYLFAVLYQIFYFSLATEHLRRVQHLEGALNRMDEKIGELSQKRNIFRQEEIIEEIEEIMLSTDVVA